MRSTIFLPGIKTACLDLSESCVAKKQTEQQQRQDAEAINLYYELLGQEYMPLKLCFVARDALRYDAAMSGQFEEEVQEINQKGIVRKPRQG